MGPGVYADKCPCCGQPGVQESLYHLIFECPAFGMERVKYISGTLAEVSKLVNQGDSEELNAIEPIPTVEELSLSWVLGGAQGGRSVPRFMPKGPTEMDLLDPGSRLRGSSVCSSTCGSGSAESV